MTQFKFNNKLRPRDLRHRNFIVAEISGEQVIARFTGENIPGVVQIVSTRSEKNGKWSFTEWTTELAPGVRAFVWAQDFQECRYVTAGTWARAYDDVRRISGMDDLTDQTIERLIRAELPGAAEKLDRAAIEAKADGTPALRALLDAQRALAEAQREESQALAEAKALLAEATEAENLRAEAEKAKANAARVRANVAKAKAAMAKGASLADLKALLG